MNLSTAMVLLIDAMQDSWSGVVRREKGGFWRIVGDHDEAWHEYHVNLLTRAPTQWWSWATVRALEQRGLLEPVERPAVYNTPRQLSRLGKLYLTNPRSLQAFRLAAAHGRSINPDQEHD